MTPAVNNYVLTTSHVGAGESYAILVPNTTATTGRIFYTNGTAEDVRYNRADVLSDGGTPPLPFGMILNADESISVNSGDGTAGIGLAQFPDPISALRVIGQAGFYACERELPSGSAVQLFSKTSTETTPGGCVNIALLAQCAEDTGVDHPFGSLSGCYDDVAGIDWSIYSA
jgi:hypothetical protein